MTIGIIGGGAAGLMAAATLLELHPGCIIHLFERNSLLGQKIIISGGGRCNVTTGIHDIPTVLTKYPRGQHFLKHALYSFPPEEVMTWFEQHGVPLKTEEDLRVFPKSNNGKDIVGAFRALFETHQHRIKVHFNCRISSIKKENNLFSVTTETEGEFVCDKILIATGGQAYRHTGSTGDGYTLAEYFGHHTTPLAPSLHSFHSKEEWPKSLAGLSFGLAHMSIKGSKHYVFDGPFLFTHKGVTGPAIFALSSLTAFEQLSPEHPLMLSIDFLPMESFDYVESYLLEKKTTSPKVLVKNVLSTFLPSSLAATIVILFSIEQQIMNDLPLKTLHKIRDFIKGAPLTLIGKGAGDEFVTAGGLDTAEINSKTLESRIIPGLYFAGELLNIDGFTGGFNLQSAWCTGRLAALSITNSIH